MTVSKFRQFTEPDSAAPFYRAAGREAEPFQAAARRGTPVLLKAHRMRKDAVCRGDGARTRP